MTEPITWRNEKRKLSELIPWDINPASIDKDEARRLEESLDQFGQVETIAISPDNELYDGHQRQLVWGASKKFGPDFVVDVRVSSRKLTERERKKLVILLRKGAVGHLDFDTLANYWEVDDLLEWGFSEKELQLGGFDLNEPEGEDPGAQVDKAEELREKWGVQSGQLWKLGEHRLICGDCTERGVVEKVMQDEKADICFTSPPYNAGKTPTEEKLGTERKYSNYSDDLSTDDYFSLLSSFTLEALEVAVFVIVNIQMLSGNKGAFTKYFSAFADRLADIAIWDKQHAQPAMAQNVLNSRFEFVLIFGEVGASRRMPGNFRGTVDNVYQGEPQRTNELGAKVHAATMPLDFAEWIVKNFSTNSVYEPFLGSGTTLIACERLHRRCRAIEISPAYVSVALQRFYDMTGIMPELISESMSQITG